MFKYVLSAFICLAFAMPASAQCGCDCAPASCRTPKKLGFVPKTIKLPQISRKCVTDACGCSRKKFSLDCVEVQSSRLALVDKDPCEKSCFQRMREGLSGLGNRGCGCSAPAPAPCGCSAPEPCGCEMAPEPDCGCGMSAAPTPVYDAGSESIMYGDPVMAPMAPMAAPASDCGCNG